MIAAYFSRLSYPRTGESLRRNSSSSSRRGNIRGVTNISVPIYLFFGGVDPFIPQERVTQIESRFKELAKEYTLKVYSDADHGFFCHERSNYNPLAAEDSWRELTMFFDKHLKEEAPTIKIAATQTKSAYAD